MSLEAMVAVLEAELPNPDDKHLQISTAKQILWGMANHAGPTGDHCFPSVERLSIYAQLGESTVRRYLAWLREARLIEVTKPAERRRPTEYRLDVLRLKHMRHHRLDEMDGKAPPVGSQGERSQGERSQGEQVTSQAERPPKTVEPGDLSSGEGKQYLTSHLNPENGSKESNSQTDWVRVLAGLQNAARGNPRELAIFKEYLQPTSIRWHGEDVAAIICDTEEQQAYLASRWGSILQHELMGVTGRRITEVQFEVRA